jgi:hypothetical protein
VCHQRGEDVVLHAGEPHLLAIDIHPPRKRIQPQATVGGGKFLRAAYVVRESVIHAAFPSRDEWDDPRGYSRP